MAPELSRTRFRCAVAASVSGFSRDPHQIDLLETELPRTSATAGSSPATACGFLAYLRGDKAWGEIQRVGFAGELEAAAEGAPERPVTA